MKGPTPKPTALRQRRNKTTTNAVLPAGQSRRRVPALPADRVWHEMTLEWWRDAWRSPMAAEWLKADVHGLYLLADLIDAYWSRPSVGLAAEIRQQRQCFGLTPIDRRRLQWEVERVEAVTRKQRPPTRKHTDDPRRILELVQ